MSHPIFVGMGTCCPNEYGNIVFEEDFRESFDLLSIHIAGRAPSRRLRGATYVMSLTIDGVPAARPGLFPYEYVADASTKVVDPPLRVDVPPGGRVRVVLTVNVPSWTHMLAGCALRIQPTGTPWCPGASGPQRG